MTSLARHMMIFCRGCVEKKRVLIHSQPSLLGDVVAVRAAEEEEEMSTKRKAESHSKVTGRPRIMKSGASRADSERDSGFSGLTPASLRS